MYPGQNQFSFVPPGVQVQGAVVSPTPHQQGQVHAGQVHPGQPGHPFHPRMVPGGNMPYAGNVGVMPFDGADPQNGNSRQFAMNPTYYDPQYSPFGMQQQQQQMQYWMNNESRKGNMGGRNNRPPYQNNRGSGNRGNNNQGGGKQGYTKDPASGKDNKTKNNQQNNRGDVANAQNAQQANARSNKQVRAQNGVAQQKPNAAVAAGAQQEFGQNSYNYNQKQSNYNQKHNNQQYKNGNNSSNGNQQNNQQYNQKMGKGGPHMQQQNMPFSPQHAQQHYPMAAPVGYGPSAVYYPYAVPPTAYYQQQAQYPGGFPGGRSPYGAQYPNGYMPNQYGEYQGHAVDANGHSMNGNMMPQGFQHDELADEAVGYEAPSWQAKGPDRKSVV